VNGDLVPTIGKVTADASAIIALLQDDDLHHNEALQLFAGIFKAYLHPVNLAEVLAAYPKKQHDAVTMALSEAIAQRGVSSRPDGHPEDGLGLTDGKDFKEILTSTFDLAEIRRSTGLPIPDSCALLATQAGAPLLTFDRRQAKAALAIGLDVVTNSVTLDL